jgi:DNA-binding IscR family transcriptional regulator
MQHTSSGWGMRAVICCRLDARQGQWLTVEELAAHIAVAPAVLMPALIELEALRLLSLQRGLDGTIQAASVPPRGKAS